MVLHMDNRNAECGSEIDWSTASVDDFVALEHIDQAMAESIVAYRSGHDGIRMLRHYVC